MSHLIDLTLTLERGMPGVDWEVARTVERDGWDARTLHLYSHAGTHMDAQVHYRAGPETIDAIPLPRCMGPARLVNLSGIAPKTLITVAHLGTVAERFVPGEILILRTDWSRHVGNPVIYRESLPRVSLELARWCVEQRVKLIGVEPPAVADVLNRQEITEVHRIFLQGGVVIVEGLANLHQIQEESFFFAATPLKVGQGDGAPCRAFAIEGGFPGWNF